METTKEKHPFILPGTYDAIWCAYNLRIIFHNGNKSDYLPTNNGIRGMSKCKAEVLNDGTVNIIE